MSVQTQIDRINQNVASTYAVLAALGADLPAEQTSDNLAQTAGTTKAVLYSPQTLTDEQKAQARTNIGVTELNIVKVDTDPGDGAAVDYPEGTWVVVR